MKLSPAISGVLVENGVESVALGEFAELPARTLTLSRLLEPSAQDVAAGEDGYALVDENGWAVYSPFESAELSASHLRTILTAAAQAQLRLPPVLVFDLRRLPSDRVSDVVRALTSVVTDLIVADVDH